MENINSAFLGSIFTLLGLVLTFFLNRILEKDKNKGILLLQIFNYRNQDIKEIYALLIKLRKYYELFIYEGNEFSEQENYMNFGPLIEIESFQTEIEKKEIFLKNEMREKLYNEITKEVEYNEEFKEFCDFIFESGISTYLTKKHIFSEEKSDEDGNGEYDYITNAIPYYFEEIKNSNGKEDMETVHQVKKIIERMNINLEKDLKVHCFTISFPEYMYKTKTIRI